jgi:hypothetical protein
MAIRFPLIVLLAMSLVLAPRAAAEPAQAVNFRFVPPPGAEIRSVSVRGSFNGWAETAMSFRDDGTWSIVIPLEPGEYQYKFFVNGHWPNDMEHGPGGAPVDPDATRYMPDGYGGQNAVRLVGTGAAEAPLPAPAALEERMAEMKRSMPAASIAVFPVIVGNEASPRVAELVALLLERCDVKRIDVPEQAFNVSARSDIWHNAGVFGTFVRGCSLAADYALLGEYRGGPRSIDAVRCVVVDRQGRPVWVDTQAPEGGDADAMACTYAMVERLRTRLGLPSPERRNAPQGHWAAHWRTQSGVPPDSEIAGMEARCRRMRAGFAQARVRIHPIRLGGESSREGAAALATLLRDRGLCRSEAAASDLPIAYEPGTDEQRMLWDLARGFRDRARKAEGGADYALYAEYFLDPGSGKARAVHFVVCDAAGEWVIVDLQNEHHDHFKRIAPASAEDCHRLVLRRIEHYLGKD